MILNLKRKISRRSLIFYFICLYSLNTLLLLLALGQGILAGFLVTRKEIPVPHFVLSKLEKSLAEYGIYAEAEKLNFDLHGRVFARRLKFFKEGAGDLLGQVDSFQLTLDIPMLLLKKVSVDSLKFQNGSLYCPAFYSNSGVSEKLAEKIHGQFKRNYNNWDIERFDFKIHNLRVKTSGIWPGAGFSFPKEPSAKPAFRPRPLEGYLSFCREALEMQLKLQLMEQPVVSISLSLDKGEPPQARVLFSADSFLGPDGLKIEYFRFEIPGIRLPGLDMVEPIAVQAGFIDWANRGRATDLTAHLSASSLGDLLTAQLENLRFSAARLQTGGINLEALGGEIRLRSFPRISGAVQALAQNRLIRLNGDFDMENYSGRLDLDSKAEVTGALLAALSSRLETTAVLDKLVLSSAPRLQLSCSFGQGFVFEKADFKLAAGPLSYGGVDFLRVTGRGQASPDFVRITDYSLEKPGERVEGSLDVDLKQGDYRLFLAGRGFPVPFNPLMPDWWDNIWKNIGFSDYPIEADLEARANWKTRKLAFHFGRYSGKEIAFQAADFDTFDLKSWSRPGFIEIFDLHATRPEGEAAGSVAWVFLGKHAIAQVLDLEANIDLAPLSALLGPDVASVVEDFDLPEPAELHLKGNLYYPAAPWTISRDIRLRAVAATPLSYHGYPLDHLDFEGRLLDERLDLERIEFGFAGGDGSGRLSLQKKDAKNQLDLDLILKGADPRQAFETLGWLPTEENPAETDSDTRAESEEPEPGSSGLLDLELSATGAPGDFLSFKGFGKVKVTKAELGKIHLFGGLSRALYGTWVDFTTLKLDSAEGRFFLDQDLVHFPDLSVSGPGSLIRASGGIIMPDRGLDFKVRVHFFESGGASLLSILGPILKPFENALELRLWGTVDKPKWRFQLDPRNVFSSPVTLRSLSGEGKKKKMLPPSPGPATPADDR